MNRAKPSNRSPDLPAIRCAVIGAGAMGISLAGMLGDGVPATMVVRNQQQAESIRTSGVRVEGLLNARAHPVVVTSIAELTRYAPFDVIFVATKTTAIEAVAGELQPVLHRLSAQESPAFVVSFQNGIDPGRALMELLGYPHVMRMVLNYGAIRNGEHSAEVMLNTPPHAVGGPDPSQRPAATRLARFLSSRGLETFPSDQIEVQVWRKGILNAAMNPVAALTDSTVGEVLDSPARTIVERLIKEGLAVAQAERIDLGDSVEHRMWETLESARPHTPSMVGDIRGGRSSEVGQLNRQIIQHGRRLGVHTPSHELITALIEAFDWRVFRRIHGQAQAAPPSVTASGSSPSTPRHDPLHRMEML